MNTSMTTAEVIKLTAVLTGGEVKRAATHEAAAKRFIKIGLERGLADPASLLAESFEDAQEILHRSLGSIAISAAISEEAAERTAADTVAEVTPSDAPKQGAVRAGSKRAIMLDMCKRPEGATELEICEALGWKACLVTLKRAAAKAGVALRAEKAPGARSRYFIDGTR